MKHLLQVLCILLLSYLLTSCDDPITQVRQQQEAKVGLGTALAELPQSPEFATVKVVSLERVDNGANFGSTCYLERGYVILGSSLSEEETISLYFQKVQSIGWIPIGEQYPRSKTLYRKPNESMEIYVGEPGVDIEDAVNYAGLRKTYKSIAFVSVDYMVPSPGQC